MSVVRPLLATFSTLGLLFALPIVASAQSFNVPATTPFTASITPQNPAPYTQATLSVLSASLTLANATMSVSVGGKQIYSGSVQPVSIPVGAVGIAMNVVVTISSNGTKYTQTIPIRPQDVVLVTEPTSSAPPLYPGEPLVPLDGGVRVVAVANFKDANGKTIDPNTLAYNWTVDNTQIADASGIGKEAIMVASPLEYRGRDVSVTVENQDGSLVGSASVSFTGSQPTVRIYQNDPLLGILYDHALSGTYTITGSEGSFYVAPFSSPTTTGNPFLQWFLNGATAQTGNSITLRPTGSGSGTASLSVTAVSDISTEATAALTIDFGNNSSSNLFGL